MRILLAHFSQNFNESLLEIIICAHKPGFLMPGHIYRLYMVYHAGGKAFNYFEMVFLFQMIICFHMQLPLDTIVLTYPQVAT